MVDGKVARYRALGKAYRKLAGRLRTGGQGFRHQKCLTSASTGAETEIMVLSQVLSSARYSRWKSFQTVNCQ